MKRNKFANFNLSAGAGYVKGKGGGALATKGAMNKAKRMVAGAKLRQAGSFIKANPGKAGLALAGLATAGGLGMAGARALSGRKKPNSLQDRIKKAAKMIR